MAEYNEDSLARLRIQLAEATGRGEIAEEAVFAHQEETEPCGTRAEHINKQWRLVNALTYFQVHQHNLEYAIEMQAADPANAISYTANGLIVIQVSTDDWLTDLERQNGSKAGVIKAYQETVDMSYQLFQLSLQFALPDGETVSPTDFEPLTLPDGAEPLSFA